MHFLPNLKKFVAKISYEVAFTEKDLKIGQIQQIQTQNFWITKKSSEINSVSPFYLILISNIPYGNFYFTCQFGGPKGAKNNTYIAPPHPKRGEGYLTLISSY